MSLLAPLYLLGLLGLFLPWLLHRFSHHEPPEQAFPTTRFLEPTRPPATSKRKLRYWPLLALRVLFLAALCLLFAQPWLRSLNDSVNAEAVQLVIVDQSFSMRASDHWQQAQSAVQTALDTLPEKDAVQLFGFAGQLKNVSEITNDRAAVKNAVSQLEPGFESADFGELMRKLNKVAGEIKKPVSATFITDAQRSNLPVQMNSLLANRIKRFDVVSVGGATPINYYLHAEARTSDSVTARVSVRVAASNTADEAGGASTKTRKSVQISMKERVLGTQSVTLAPGESQTIQFDGITLPSNFDELMRVAFVESDFLDADDQVDIPVRGLTAIDIALTNIGSQPNDQARVFVVTALETDGDASVDMLDASSAMAPSVRHAVVFVDDLANVPAAITRFVMAGGNALVLPNTRDSLANQSQASDASSITRIDLAHPLALGDIDWFAAKFYATPEFKALTDDRILMRLDAGQPILIERSIIDGGRLLLLNDGLDGFNTDLPLQPAFVQLMQQIVRYFDASNALPIELEVGKELYVPANTQILTPAGEPMLDIAQLSTANNIRIQLPGVYSVLGANSAEKLTAVVDSGESNLMGLNQDELEAWEARHDVSVEVESATTQEDAINTNSNTTDITSDKLTLWRWLLPVLLLFLVAESLFANRMLWVRRDGL